MAGEDQYVNPIIQAMVHSANLQSQAADRDLQKQKEFNDQKARENAQKLQERQIENEAKNHQQLVDLQAQHMKLIGENARMESILNLGKAGATGQINIPQALNSLQQPGQAPGLTQGLTPDFAPTPEQYRANQAASAGAIATAEQKPKTEAKITELGKEQENKMAQLGFEADTKEKLQGKELASNEKIAGMSKSTQLAIANMTNAVHLKGLEMQYSVTPEMAQSLVMAAGTGQIKLNPANPIQRSILDTMQQSGWRVPEQKDIDALKSGQQLIPLFNQVEEFAKALPDTKAQAFGQGKVLAGANAIGWPTDTQNQLNQIISQALNVGRAVEGMTGGRVLAKQMELDLNSIASGGITKTQALARLKNLKDLYTNKMENVLMPGMPTSQREALYVKQGVLPSWIVTAPQKDSTGHSIDVDASIKFGKRVYSHEE